MSEIPEQLLNAFEQNNVAVFVGEQVNKNIFALSHNIAENLAGSLSRQPQNKHDLFTIAQLFKEEYGEDSLYQIFVRQFTEPRLPSPKHDLIVRLQPRVIITTCYDTLLEKALEGLDIVTCHSTVIGRHRFPIHSEQGISSNLLQDLKKVLNNCNQLDSYTSIKSIFVDKTINEWEKYILDGVSDKISRVSNLIAALANRYNSLNENVLVLFLRALKTHYSKDDQTYVVLSELISKLESEKRISGTIDTNAKILATWLLGRIDQPESMIVTDYDYRSLFQGRQERSLPDELKGELAERTWLFLGFDTGNSLVRDLHYFFMKGMDRPNGQSYFVDIPRNSESFILQNQSNVDFINIELDRFLNELHQTLQISGFEFHPSVSTDEDNTQYSQNSNVLSQSRSPYKELHYYDENDADIFFGRDADVNSVIQKIKYTVN